MSEAPKSNGYRFHVGIFCPEEVPPQSQLLELLGGQDWVTVTDMTLPHSQSFVGRVEDCEVYGVARYRKGLQPEKNLTDWEAYTTEAESYRRIAELCDALCFFVPSRKATSEAEAYLKKLPVDAQKPIVLIGKPDYLPPTSQSGTTFSQFTSVQKAKSFLEAHFRKLAQDGYYPPHYYPALSPEAIAEHISLNKNPYFIRFGGMVMQVEPNVYPSNRFRSSKMFAELVAKLSQDKKVLDMACGHGAMGFVALANGARSVIQCDINPYAVANTDINARLLNFTDRAAVYKSDTFDAIPPVHKGSFDLIAFNPPFHANYIPSDNPLYRAFYTKEHQILEKFMAEVREWLAPGGSILLGFSNKDLQSLGVLEKLIAEGHYAYEDVWYKNTETIADNRVYRLSTDTEKLY